MLLNGPRPSLLRSENMNALEADIQPPLDAEKQRKKKTKAKTKRHRHVC